MPERAVVGNPNFMHWIPGWTGYDYPLDLLRGNVTLPDNVQLYQSGELPSGVRFEPVRAIGPLPAWGAVNMVSTMFCQSLTMSRGNWRTPQCIEAYKKAAEQWQVVAPVLEQDHPFILIHFRAPDDNTESRDEIPFCTREVVKALHASGVFMKVVSNNHRFSMFWLKGLTSLQLVHSKSPYKDLRLALSAAAIVQHASTGWSSFTSVPAMAKNIPLINTFTGSDHRFNFFEKYGKLPEEFYSCNQTGEFVQIAKARYTHAMKE